LSLQVTSLASGSSGNCTVVRSPQGTLLVDCGLALKHVRAGLAELEIAEDLIAGIVVTHEHADHVGTLGIVAGALKVPVYLNAGTLAMSKKRLAGREIEAHIFQNGNNFEVGGILVEPFSIPHDGVDTVAFCFSSGRGRVGVATDFGHVTQLVRQKLLACDSLLIEANYDRKKLLDSPRDWKLKQRILGQHGHLDNVDTMKLVAELLQNGKIQEICFAHLSDECNDPGLVLDLAQQTLATFKPPSEIKLQIAPRQSLSRTMSI
jgi:phosphoribosyl 1,2-cyclic phosphodiesterase